MIDTHVLNRGGRGVQSPADRLLPDGPEPSANWNSLTRPGDD